MFFSFKTPNIHQTINLSGWLFLSGCEKLSTSNRNHEANEHALTAMFTKQQDQMSEGV